MIINAALRIKNEGKWIKRVIESITPLCEEIHVFDDNSTDDTREIVADCERVTLYRSPFNSLNEVRDKNWLLDQVRLRCDWILWIDGDELLEQASIPVLQQTAHLGVQCISFKIRYLWNDEQTVRVDGVYGNFRRQSMFRPGEACFAGVGKGPNFHCGNTPRSLFYKCAYPDVSLLHLGYRDRADRIRKYHWYNSVDPKNEAEDCYRHVIQGDHATVPAGEKLKHGGPLKLEKL